MSTIKRFISIIFVALPIFLPLMVFYLWSQEIIKINLSLQHIVAIFYGYFVLTILYPTSKMVLSNRKLTMQLKIFWIVAIIFFTPVAILTYALLYTKETMMYKLHNFLDEFFNQIIKAGLDISEMTLDHVAYQASSSEDYEGMKPDFFKIGNEVHEGIIGGRRVAVFELYEPIEYKKYSIKALELIEPDEEQEIESRFQHAEFVINTTFEQYIEKYPLLNWDTSSMGRDKFAHLKLHFSNGMTLKFLLKPVLELVQH